MVDAILRFCKYLLLENKHGEEHVTERTYNQFCGVAQALDLVGERWALLVVRDLVLGPRRFTDLQADLPGIATNVLASRLRELERNGVVRRRTLPPPGAAAVYELTGYGRELEPVLLALGRWGAKSLGVPRPEQSLRSGWIGVAMRAYSVPDAAAGTRATIELRLDDGTFHVRIDDGEVTIRSGPSEDPSLTVEAGNLTLLALLRRFAPAGELVEQGLLRLDGDAELLEVLTEVVRLPGPAESEAEAT
jgi:DNA-binding HxlR family transcriptional regulator